MNSGVDFLYERRQFGQVRYFSGAIRKQECKLKDREGMSVPVPGWCGSVFSFLFSKKP
jgi:hypothetical protein